MPDENGNGSNPLGRTELRRDFSSAMRLTTPLPPLTRRKTPRVRPNRTARAPMTPGSRPRETRPKPRRT